MSWREEVTFQFMMMIEVRFILDQCL